NLMKGKKIEYFDALYNVAKVINASLELPQVLSDIVRCVTETMGVKASSLRLLDHRKKKLLLAATHGLTTGYIRKGPVLVEKSGLDRKALKGESIWIEDAQIDKNFQYGERAKEEGIKSVLVVPLGIGKKVIGVLRVYTGKIHAFSKKDIQFLEAVASLSAIAIENARLHQNTKTECDLLTAYKFRLDDN
ncbi:MAG: GAF domain-containing protein, partial [Syntrophales bacterium LBB04]|nr:GAF domain-containing protein [Syntrophales bacterium LBB04]